MDIRQRIEVSGIVQGVGFRPFIYRLAHGCNLVGTVVNTAAGVTIEIQGAAEQVLRFQELLPREAPPLSRITKIQAQPLDLQPETEFRILHSEKAEAAHTLISPEIATCDDCLRELFDPADRRYKYPFINCTNCGPRFTIVRSIPYDRAWTSMNVFPMCPECQAEYDHPLDRRFHAQPNACWACGPQLQLWNRNGRILDWGDPVEAAAERLASGAIIAVKGLGGFHLAVDATSERAVHELRERKRRVGKPFAIMARDLDAIRRICILSDDEARALTSPQRPILLLQAYTANEIASEVAPGNRHLGVFLPYTPVHHLLFACGSFDFLVMTSGNLSEEPIAIDNDEAVERLGPLADYLLVHNRDILCRCDDSVARFQNGKMRQVRRSRGFVPVPVFLEKPVAGILAVGGELKNTICLTRQDQAFLSQHIGDLENVEAYNFFREANSHLQEILEIKPSAIAYDLHPDYLSTRWALEQKDLPRIGVQHHHAHIASCMAENRIHGQVIGIALDGTGYGADGAIWGGEILVCNALNFQRAGHFAYTPIPGGAAAIREPWRMALSYLWQEFGSDALHLGLPFMRDIEKRNAQFVLRMLENGINSPLTSSCGRLFDAVAAIANLRTVVTYEAQAAIELEACLDRQTSVPPYAMQLIDYDDHFEISHSELMRQLLEDTLDSVPAGIISRKFHDGLADVLLRAAMAVRERCQIDRICLSGGTFQNVWLAQRLENLLREEEFNVFTHSEVPCGDGGLSLGQAIVAAATLESAHALESSVCGAEAKP
ncbi:MAG TPA: carbamoyltransferase HypF [Candidatus Angelobacter sp.]